MRIQLKLAEELGFNSYGEYPRSQIQNHFYRADRSCQRVTIISNNTPQVVSYFDLTENQFAQFVTGRLALVPPGCRHVLEGNLKFAKPMLVFVGVIESAEHLREILKLIK